MTQVNEGVKTTEGIEQLAEKLKIDRTDQPQRPKRFQKLLTRCGILVTIILLAVVAMHFRPPTVEVVTVTNERVGAAGHPIFRVSGYVNYPHIVNVSTSYDFPIIKLNFKEGDRVTKDDVLAVLNNTDLIAEKQREASRLNDAEKTLARNLILYEAGVKPYTELQNAETQVDITRASLAQASAQVDKTIIHAPFSGIITKKLAEVGGKPNSGICTMIDDSKTLVEVDVSQNDLSKIVQMQPAIVTLDAYPDNEFAAVVDQIMPTGDKAKNTVQVKLQILKPDNSFWPEMSAKVFFVSEIQQDNRKVQTQLIVPKLAIVTEDGTRFVWKVDGEKAVKQEVIVIDDLEDRSVVINGLVVDDRVILDPGRYNLKNEQKISVKKAT